MLSKGSCCIAVVTRLICLFTLWWKVYFFHPRQWWRLYWSSEFTQKPPGFHRADCESVDTFVILGVQRRKVWLGSVSQGSTCSLGVTAVVLPDWESVLSSFLPPLNLFSLSERDCPVMDTWLYFCVWETKRLVYWVYISAFEKECLSSLHNLKMLKGRRFFGDVKWHVPSSQKDLQK